MPGLVYLPPMFLTTGIPRRPADAQTSDAIDAGQCGALTAQIDDDDGIQSINLGGGVRASTGAFRKLYLSTKFT